MSVPQKLKDGAPVSRNWRTVNALIEQVNTLNSQVNTLRAAVAELRRRPRDVGAFDVVTCNPDTGVVE
jgi:tRNA1(Val) A37 N6-methylase TrmN6